MKIVVDEYPVDCYDCPLSKMDYSKQQKVCGLGFDKRNCSDNFISYEMMKEEYELRQKFNGFEIGSSEFEAKYKNLKRADKEYKDSLKKNRNEEVEKKRLSFVDNFGDLDKFNSDLDELLKYGKENIEKGREGTIVIPKKEADNIHIRDIDGYKIDGYKKENVENYKRNEEEIKKQREEALDRASKGGFLDTGSVVSIGDEIRKVKDEVRKMGADIHHDNKEENTGDKTLTKEQAAEMMCENFGGLV